jgi:Uma2 family endonuclease
MSIEQYEKLVNSGVFTKRDKFQLIDGILVKKVTQNPAHSVAGLLCAKALGRVVRVGWHLRPDKPVRLPPDAEPEPDQCVVRGAERDYLLRHPGASDVGLLVEIADSSLAADRAMARTFGASGIPVYWLVNLRDRQVEVHTMPTESGYDSIQVYGRGEVISVVLDGAETGRVMVDEILP